MARAQPFRAVPPPLVSKRLQEAAESRLCLVQELGPTCFLVRPMNREATTGSDLDADPGAASAAAPVSSAPAPIATYKISVGEHQRCTCGDRELCVHILFVMLKVFRLAADDPLVWQRSLVDAEISKLLAQRAAIQARAVPATAVPSAPSKK